MSTDGRPSAIGHIRLKSLRTELTVGGVVSVEEPS